MVYHLEFRAHTHKIRSHFKAPLVKAGLGLDPRTPVEGSGALAHTGHWGAAKCRHERHCAPPPHPPLPTLPWKDLALGV